MISVTIPVGPFPSNTRWLGECLESLRSQKKQPAEVLIIDDMAGLDPVALDKAYPGIRVHRNAWRLGVGASFNVGVALARNRCVFMLGSDDWMEPTCLALCWEEFKLRSFQDGYYYVGVHYSDNRGDQTVPCNEAMVTKGLFQHNGGFPIEAGSGACDAALISIMMANPQAGRLFPVAGGAPLVTYRVHPDTDTASRGEWQGVILPTRDILTRTWQPAQWGRVKP